MIQGFQPLRKKEKEKRKRNRSLDTSKKKQEPGAVSDRHTCAQRAAA